MYAPSNTTIAGTITSLSTVDLSLHAFLNVTWMILLPYTFLGVALMAYSHAKLRSGERKLKRQDGIDAAEYTVE